MLKNNWKIKSWDELSKDIFHDIIQLRASIFIVEQDCPYLDVDGKDKKSHHLYLYKKSCLIAYARLIPIGISYSNGVSIGRVTIHPNYRGKKLAREMMEIAIEKVIELFNEKTIIISAQTYLLPFYSSLGFYTSGEEYLEDNLPHIKMILKK